MTSQSQTTQGPWRVQAYANGTGFFIRSGKAAIAKVLVSMAQSIAEKEANAHLMAAAPDMREALELFVKHTSFDDDYPFCNQVAREALAKASGK